MLLENKIAIITGGSQGLGEIMSKKFADEGCTVYIADLHKPNFELNSKLHYVYTDISDHNDVSNLVNQVIAEQSHIDILVNNAGIIQDSLINKMTDDQWNAVIDVDLKGAFYMVREIIPHMYKQNEGSIINISSIVGEYGNIGQTNYAAAKAGLIGMTYTWAKEFTRKGANIRTNAIAPGYMNTAMIQDVPEKILNRITSANPLKRLGEPEEIADAALFLASDKASYINGHILDVNGGARL